VCYHNLQRRAEYSRLGHSEVVSVSVPVDDKDKLAAMVNTYFSLFVNGDRPDKVTD
jgi:hypothetical protein